MPEGPEVERAAELMRRATTGKTIAHIQCHHSAQRRTFGVSDARVAAGSTIVTVRRRGKVQIIELSTGQALHVHFRMTGDWLFDDDRQPLPRTARISITFTDDTVAILVDPRALSTMHLRSSTGDPPGLGPEADDPALTAPALHARIASRRAPIKTVLLDQGTLAGLGNIYAAEALWRAKIDPRSAASQLTVRDIARLLRSIRHTLSAASGARYRSTNPPHLAVYDREGEPCTRCQTPIARIVQSGRSTWFCPSCQSPVKANAVATATARRSRLGTPRR